MNIDFFNQLIKPVGILLPIVIGFFTIYSSIYGYVISDSFKKNLFSSPTEIGLYKIFKGFINLISSLLLSSGIFAYALITTDTAFTDFVSDINNLTKEGKAYLTYFIIYFIVFIFSIAKLPDIYRTLIPSNSRSKHSNFYVLSQELSLNDIPCNTKVFLVSMINKDSVLLTYYLNKEFVRLIYSLNEIQKIKIFYHKQLSFFQKIKEFNESITKETYYFAFLPTIFIMLPSIIMSFISKSMTNIYFGATIAAISELIILSPSLIKYIKIAYKKIYLTIKNQNKPKK